MEIQHNKIVIRYNGIIIVSSIKELTQTSFNDLIFKRLSGGSITEYYHKDYKGI